MSLSDLFIIPATDALRQAVEHYREGNFLTTQQGKKDLIAELMTLQGIAKTFEVNIRSDLTDSQLQIIRQRTSNQEGQAQATQGQAIQNQPPRQPQRARPQTLRKQVEKQTPFQTTLAPPPSSSTSESPSWHQGIWSRAPPVIATDIWTNPPDCLKTTACGVKNPDGTNCTKKPF